MKFRPQRGSLEESMAACVELSGIGDLSAHLVTSSDRLTFIPYGYDDRVKWDTYCVCIDGQAIGFCT